MANFRIEDGNFVLQGITWDPSPHALAANANDLAVTSAVVFLTPSAAIDVTGFDGSQILARGGSMLWIRNKSATHAVTLKADTTSAAGNRIYTADGLDAVIGPKRQAFLLYDTDEAGANPGWWVFA
jgi:hypothetical protein